MTSNELIPNIIAITFEVHRSTAQQLERVEYLFDPEEAVLPTALNDPARDFNAKLREYLAEPDVQLVSTSIAFDHPHRAVLPIAPARIRPDSIGEVFKMAVDAMAESGEFREVTPEQDQFLQVAALVGYELPPPAGESSVPTGG